MAEKLGKNKQYACLGDDFAEPIAITAMSGVFATGADLEDFWRQIESGTPATPCDLRERWGNDSSRYYCKDGKIPEKTYLHTGFAIDDAKVPHQDATILDRQVRIGRSVIETVLHKITAKTGDFGEHCLNHRDIGLVCGTSWTGPSFFDHSIAKTLASYRDMIDGDITDSLAPYDAKKQLKTLGQGLGGPLSAVDTACASSLYAIETAINQIRCQQAKAMVVCGLSVSLPLHMFTAFSTLGALSRSGHIRPFTALHDGIMLGEGAAAILLEPLSEAQKRGQPILGVITAWGLSADGCDRSIFAPGPSGLALLFERTYKNINPAEIDYIEAHGTGTPTGDKTEIKMLHDFFSAHTGADRKIPLGSVKAIVGHTLAAAGLASILKVLLMLNKKIIPPHLDAPMHPDLAGSCLTLLPHKNIFTDESRPRKVAVSSLGFGGANAHFVIESYENASSHHPQQHDTLEITKNETSAAERFTPLAIVDFDGQFGRHVDLTSLQNSLASKTQTPPESMTFPNELIIERAGLRAGPNFLIRIDPLQLLLIEQAGRILRRRPQYGNNKETGIIVVTNHGGEMSLKLARRSAWLSKYDRQKVSEKMAQIVAAKLGPELTMEAIGSGLPALCSGYPAFHFNLSGFHKTIAGDSGCFFDYLKLIPGYLRTTNKQILLGAAHSLLPGALNSNERPLSSGEGVGFLLLKTLEDCERTGVRPLAVIDAIIDDRSAANYSEALKIAGLAAEQVDHHEICQLRQTFTPLKSLQTAQTVTGFLHEATGIEAIITALLCAQRLATVEVRDGERCVMTIVIRKQQHQRLAPIEFKEPLSVVFRSVAPELTRASFPPIVRETHDIFTSSSDIIALIDNSKRVMHKFLTCQSKILELQTAAELNGEVPVVKAANQVTGSGDKAGCGDFLTSSGLQSFLGISNETNVVITDVHLTPAASSTATILVDEHHPYFFDHPLDHVPGILLLEGVLQLATLRAGLYAKQRGMSTFFAQKLSFRFINYCEKNWPPLIEMNPVAMVHKSLSCVGHVKQNGKVLCRFDVQFQEALAVSPRFSRETDGSFEKELPKWLHKQHDDNVLVSKLTCVGGGNYSCKMAPPPKTHILAAGSEEFYSGLYLLEASRQFVMLLAHQALNIPLGIPMTLVSFEFNMDRPLLRNEEAELRFSLPPAKGFSGQKATVISCEIYDRHGKVGVVAMRTIIHDADEYKNLRARSSGDQGEQI